MKKRTASFHGAIVMVACMKHTYASSHENTKQGAADITHAADYIGTYVS